MPGGPGTPRWVVPTSVASRTASSPYKFSNIPKTLGVALDQKFRRRKASVSTRSNLDTIKEGFIILIGASPMMRE